MKAKGYYDSGGFRPSSRERINNEVSPFNHVTMRKMYFDSG